MRGRTFHENGDVTADSPGGFWTDTTLRASHSRDIVV